MIAAALRSESSAVPWLPIWVAALVSRATSAMSRASETECVSGFWQKQAFPIFMAMIDAKA